MVRRKQVQRPWEQGSQWVRRLAVTVEQAVCWVRRAGLRCTGCVGCGGCLGEGYKQEKMYFAATRKSRREVRVGG